jgi:tricorn protease-like protein
MTRADRSHVRHAALPLVVFLTLVTALALDASAVTTRTTRVNVSSNGTETDETSNSPSISADGRFVAFQSYATNLVGGDTNGTFDVFVHDRETGRTKRVSVSSAGTQGNSNSYAASISANGRFVAFQSYATNLVGGDTNSYADVFVFDRETGKTKRISVSSAGVEGNEVSASPKISADGRFVAFQSYATNLVGGDTNGYADVFVFDRETGKTKRVSVSSAGAEGNDESGHPSISANGRFVAFQSGASDLVGFDMNGVYDVFVNDRETGRTKRVSVSSAGTEGNAGSYWPSISADGRYVTVYSDASNLVAGDTNAFADVFVNDRETGKTKRVSVSSAGTEGNDGSYDPCISADGRFVAFSADATNLVAGDEDKGASDIFVHDRETGKTTLVSVSSDGTMGNAGSFAPVISAGGRFVAFESSATNLVGDDDTNATRDIFVRGPLR